MVEYRPLGNEADETFWRYGAYAFSPESGPVEFDPEPDELARIRMGDRRGVFPEDAAEEEQPRCVCVHYWFNALIRDEWHPAPGLSAVASPPEYRRSGYAKQLLAHALQEYRTRDEQISLLWPFRHGFYQQYGWATCSVHHRYTCEPEALAFARAEPNGPGRYRALEADNVEGVSAVYDTFIERYALSIGRDEQWWRQHILSTWESDPFVYVWERDGKPRGYLVYTMEGTEGDRTMEVVDMAFKAYEALLALVAFCANHDSQVTEVRFTLPTDIRLLDLAPEPEKITCERKTGAMARIVDVETTLAALEYPAIDAHLTLSVTDPLVEWNDRAFALAIESGEATCQPISGNGVRDVSLDVGTLTQLVVGYRSAEELSRAGQLDASRKVVETLDRIWPPTQTYLGTVF